MTAVVAALVLPWWIATVVGWALWVALHAATGGLR